MPPRSTGIAGPVRVAGVAALACVLGLVLGGAAQPPGVRRAALATYAVAGQAHHPAHPGHGVHLGPAPTAGTVGTTRPDLPGALRATGGVRPVWARSASSPHAAAVLSRALTVPSARGPPTGTA